MSTEAPKSRQMHPSRVLRCDHCDKAFRAFVCEVGRRFCSHRCSTQYRASQNAERFWTHVKKGDPNSCWFWNGARDPTGYGHYRTGVGHRTSAHRFAYSSTVGPIPVGLFVCHHCDNRACCNPSHLWLGTAKDNTRDMITKGRGRYGQGYKEFSQCL